MSKSRKRVTNNFTDNSLHASVSNSLTDNSVNNSFNTYETNVHTHLQNISNIHSKVVNNITHEHTLLQQSFNHTSLNVGTAIVHMNNTLGKAEKEAGGFKKVMGDVFKGLDLTVEGITKKIAGGIADGISECISETNKLYDAQATLSTTMKSMGTFSQEGYEQALRSSKELSKDIKFNTTDIIELQSQLRGVGNIGESQLNNVAKASADLATKLHIDLKEAGGMMAGVMRNPREIGELGKKLNINPAVIEHIQKLAKGGHEAKAQMELLAAVQKKVGGAAQAAFNADPMGRFNKVMEEAKTKIGGGLIAIMTPVLNRLTDIGMRALPYIEKGITFISNLFNGLNDNTGTWGIYMKSIKGLFDKVWKTIQSLWGNVSHIVKGITDWVSKSELVKDIFVVIQDVAGVVWSIIGKIGDAVQWVWDTIMKPILDKVESAYRAVKEFFGGKVEIDVNANTQGIKAANEAAKTNQDPEAQYLVQQANDLLAHDKFKGDSRPEFMNKLDDFTEKMKADKLVPADIKAFREFMNPKASVPGSKEPQLGPEKMDTKATAINNGGQRGIIINIGKQIEKIEQHIIGGSQQAADEMEGAIREALRRVLYSVNHVPVN